MSIIYVVNIFDRVNRLIHTKSFMKGSIKERKESAEGYVKRLRSVNTDYDDFDIVVQRAKLVKV